MVFVYKIAAVFDIYVFIFPYKLYLSGPFTSSKSHKNKPPKGISQNMSFLLIFAFSYFFRQRKMYRHADNLAGQFKTTK